LTCTSGNGVISSSDASPKIVGCGSCGTGVASCTIACGTAAASTGT